VTESLSNLLDFATEDRWLVKRVIGLPGDTLERSGGSVFVNGTRLEEPYASPGPGDFAPVEVPPGFLFVAGDDRRHSSDSRNGLGLVPSRSIVGRATLIIWPPSRMRPPSAPPSTLTR